MKNVLLMMAVFAISVGCMNSPKVTFREDPANRKIDVSIDGSYFTSYIYPTDVEKPILYLLMTSSGKTITRGYPLAPRPFERTDHPHQVGLWFNFGDVNGLDFWNNSFAIKPEDKPRYGSIRFVKVLSTEGNKLVTLSNWVDNEEKVLLEEVTTFEFGGDVDQRTIVRTATLTAKQPVVMKGNKEGMLALRMDRAFEEPATKPESFTDANGVVTDVPVLNNEGVNGFYRNSLGNTKGDVWGKRANWTSVDGEIDGDKVTVLVCDYKKNPNFPAWSHARGYGLFGTNNMGGKEFDKSFAEELSLSINPGESVEFKYLVVIKNNGFLSETDMNKIWETFNR